MSKGKKGTHTKSENKKMKRKKEDGWSAEAKWHSVIINNYYNNNTDALIVKEKKLENNKNINKKERNYYKDPFKVKYKKIKSHKKFKIIINFTWIAAFAWGY